MRHFMQEWEHLVDGGKVATAGTLAVVTSFQTDIEWWIRMAVLIATLYYTVVKVWAHHRGKPPAQKEKENGD